MIPAVGYKRLAASVEGARSRMRPGKALKPTKDCRLRCRATRPQVKACVRAGARKNIFSVGFLLNPHAFCAILQGQGVDTSCPTPPPACTSEIFLLSSPARHGPPCATHRSHRQSPRPVLRCLTAARTIEGRGGAAPGTDPERLRREGNTGGRTERPGLSARRGTAGGALSLAKCNRRGTPDTAPAHSISEGRRTPRTNGAFSSCAAKSQREAHEYILRP